MRVILSLLMCCLLSWPLAVTAGGVSVEGDLFLGVWSPQQSRWESTVPVCITGDSSQSLFRVVASGDNANVFALSNDLEDQVRYKVFWHTGKNYKRREALAPATPSRKAYAGSGQCRKQPTGYLRVRLNRKDIENAIPAIYQDNLVLMLSPLSCAINIHPTQNIQYNWRLP